MIRTFQAPFRNKTTMLMAKLESPKPLPSIQKSPAGSRFRKLSWLGVGVAVIGTVGFFRFQPAAGSPETHLSAETQLRQVHVTSPEQARGGTILLPGTIQPYQATDLFARANGFLKSWNGDIGTVVKAGQVLAEIETPELDQELGQAVAQLKQGQADHQQAIAELEETKADITLAEANVVKAKANLDYAVSQANRYDVLLTSRAASRQEYEAVVRERDARQAEWDSSRADLLRRKASLGTRLAIIDSKEASVRNREANVQRLRDLTGFQKVVAPFDGVVTRRNAEVGMLVTSGSNTGTRPLFSVAQIDLLRVQVSVPQSSALSIKVNDPVQVMVPEKPGRPYHAKVSRTAGAVEPVSRSLLVEVELPNADFHLLPGLYAQIQFASTSNAAGWNVPAKTLLMRSNGPHVVIISEDGIVKVQKVTLGRDFGTTAEVLNGLVGGEQLAINPPDDLRDGQKVQIAEVREEVAKK